MRLHSAFHVVPNWRASPEIVAPSKCDCMLVQRSARPRRKRGAYSLSVLQECHRLAGLLQAPPAPFAPLNTHWDPGPRLVNDFCQ